MKQTYVIVSEFGELLDIADHIQNVEGQGVKFIVTNSEYKKIGEGIVEKEDSWLDCLGKGYTWVFDGCSAGKLQDWLRDKGEFVFGGSEEGDKLENERQLNQKWFKEAGFLSVESKNFKDIDEATEFVESNLDRQWVLKQNGDAPKSINHVGKFEGNEDMLFHLEELKKKWSESQMGKFDCDLMEKVEGLEVAASVFFDGEDYCRNAEGKVVGFLNFEEKKECDGGQGETTGEMGTTFYGCTEDDELFRDILVRPKLLEVLRASGFRGVFDVNCIKTDKGIVALEPTMRPGIPSTSYEFMAGLDMDTSELLDTVSRATKKPVEIVEGWGMVMVVAAKPYPIDSDVEESATSVGEKLWPLRNGDPIDSFTPEHWTHICLENFYREDGTYKVATKCGYLLTVTYTGKGIASTREDLIRYIEDSLYVPGMKFRTDIGKRVEGRESVIEE